MNGVRLWTLEKDGQRLMCERGGPDGQELSVWGRTTVEHHEQAYEVPFRSAEWRAQLEAAGYRDVFADVKKRAFWHAFDVNAPMATHNLKIRTGKISSASYDLSINPQEAGLAPYELTTVEREKEAFFEAWRAMRFADRPSRYGALFLFTSDTDAEAGNRRWFGGRRVVLQTRIVECLAFGEFDATYLNSASHEWQTAAESYWSGARSPAPCVEALVCGVIELLNWEPHGRLLPPMTT
jgi:hypothetical protein